MPQQHMDAAATPASSSLAAYAASALLEINGCSNISPTIPLISNIEITKVRNLVCNIAFSVCHCQITDAGASQRRYVEESYFL